MIQFMRFRNVFHLTLLVVLLLSAAGCENKSSQETSASLTDDDFVILASLAEGETGLGQTAVEIIPVPKISSQGFRTSMPAAAALEAMENEALVVTPPTGEDLTFEEKVQISLRNAGFYEGEIDGRARPGGSLPDPPSWKTCSLRYWTSSALRFPRDSTV